MEKILLTKDVLLSAVKKNQKKLFIIVIITISIFTLMMAVFMAAKEGIVGFLFILQGGGVLIAFFYIMQRRGFRILNKTVENDEYFILQQTVVKKESDFDSVSEIRHYSLWLSNGQYCFANKNDYKIATIGSSYYLFFANDDPSHLLWLFDTQYYVLSDEV